MLFRCTSLNGPLEQILLPNGDHDSSWPEDGKHPNSTAKARRHFAGLALERQGAVDVVHVPLKGMDVAIVLDGETTTGPKLVELDCLPRLNPVTFGKGKVDAKLAAATVTVTGGVLGGYPPLDLTKFENTVFANEDVKVHGARLMAQTSATIIIRKKGQDKLTLQINPGDKVAIYNFEDRYPSIEDLQAVGNCELEMSQDDDFIWLYSLLAPWDKKKHAHPAPVMKCKSPPRDPDKILEYTFITVFTCFPAVWETSKEPS